MGRKVTFGSLFAGIGGCDLGLERAGMQCVWQVEIDEWCSQVLAKHWPHVARFRDVRDCGAHNLSPVDVICGGFPCQDISNAGLRAGIVGERSGLWTEYARIIGELRPRYVLVENVAALLDRGIQRVLGDLAALFYDTDGGIISACALGAPHTRERLFIVAHTDSVLGQAGIRSFADRAQAHERRNDKARLGGWVESFSGVRGISDGVPARMERLRGLGNAVSPPVAEWFGRLIMDMEATCLTTT